MLRNDTCLVGNEAERPAAPSREDSTSQETVNLLEARLRALAVPEERPRTLFIPPEQRPPSPLQEAILVLIHPIGPWVGSCHPLAAAPVVIGRESECGLWLDERSVSRRHARIEKRGKGYHVTDLQSTNGTWINGKRVTEGTLTDGDTLAMGGCVLRFLASSNPEARYHEEQCRRATTDLLTGIPNRRCFTGLLDAEWVRAREGVRPLSLLLLDIDHFKEVNDRFGHLVGDALLRELAQRLRAGVRSKDRVARYGGEEFAVLLPSTDRSAARLVAERIRRQVHDQQFSLAGVACRVTVSLGVGSSTEARLAPKDLLREADEHLYLAKRNGRNQVAG